MHVLQGVFPVRKIVKRSNRGNHFICKYPNDSFRKYIKLKMLDKFKALTDPDVLDNLPQVIEIAKQN